MCRVLSQAYLPDTMQVDENSLSFLSLLDRLRAKTELCMRLVEQYYGPEVTSSSSSSSFAYTRRISCDLPREHCRIALTSVICDVWL